MIVKDQNKIMMPVNLEVKGMLAKCLAMENLIIEHKNVDTAMFDVEHRILTLPNWKKASATVYDLLVAHEVGHSLATPNIDWTIEYPEVPKDFVNVVEDARIERLMKKKYPGLARTFYVGYNELNDEDFFCTEGQDLNQMNLIDRINLYFKIGAFHHIQFDDIENEFVTRISLAETFDDVMKISQDLVNYVKKKKEEEPASLNQKNQEQQESSSQGEGQDEENENNSQNEGTAEDKVQSNSNGGTEPQQKAEDEETELKSQTSRSFDEKAKELNDKRKSLDTTAYVELPVFDLSKLILPNSYIHSLANEYYQKSIHKEYYDSQLAPYLEFKKSAEREVSYLVKEFECKKSADQYARASTARTGVLNTSVLHSYKYNEDLFKKVSVLPDGKNHGLIFVLDWSGSMADYLLDTYKQLCSLIWFCRKVSIPFEVYAFTTDVNAYYQFDVQHTPTFVKKENVICPEDTFRMMNLFTSKVNNRELDQQMRNVWASCNAYQSKHGYVPTHMSLSGTPLGDSMISLNQIIPQFLSQNQVQKVNVIFLTDGEGGVNPYGRKTTKYNGEEYIAYGSATNVVLRNRKSGRMYSSYQYGNFASYAKTLLSYVRDEFPNVNIINFRISSSRELNGCYEWCEDGISYDKIKESFRKNKFVSFQKSAFDRFIVLSSTSVNADSDLNVDSGSSKTAIKTAFTKMMKNKKTNKAVLSEFVELIA